MVVRDQVRTLNTELVEKSQDHRGLAVQRPVGAPGRLRISQAEQVRCDAAVAGRESRDYLAPYERRERTAMQQQQWRSRAFFVVSHSGAADLDKALAGGKPIRRHG